MAVNVHGDKSLMFKTGVDNSGLRQGAQKSKGILSNLKGWIVKLGIFAGIMAGLKQLKTVTFDYAQTLEKSMKEVSTLSDEITQNFEDYRNKVVQLSTQVVDSADDLSKGLYQIVSAGYDGAEGMELLEIAAKAATAGVTDTKTAAGVLTSAMTAWGIEMEGAQKVADDLFNTIKGGVLKLEDLDGQLGKVASIAAPVGIEMREILGALKTMTKRGMPVEESMQRMQAAIRDFATEFGTDWIENMSLQERAIQLYEESGGKFENILESMTDEGAQFVNVMGKYMDSARSDLEAYNDTTGAAEEAWKKMTSSSINQSALLADKIKAKLIPLGNFMNDAWNQLLGNVNALFEDTEDKIEQTGRQIEAIKKEKNQTSELIEEYKDLSDKSQKSEEDKKRLKEITEKIAETIPEAVEQWDAETGAINLNSEAVDNHINKLGNEIEKRQEMIEQFDTIAKKLERNAKLKGREPSMDFETQQGLMNFEMTQEMVADEIKKIKEERREVTKELNRLADEENLGVLQQGQLEDLQARLQGLNQQLDSWKEKLEEIKDTGDDGDDGSPWKPKQIDIDKEKSLMDMRASFLMDLRSRMEKLNDESSEYNEAERRRIKEQIKWYKNLYTAISEASRMGMEKWSQRQAESLVSGGLVNVQQMLTPKIEDPAKDKDADTEGFAESLKDVQTQLYRLSDTVGELDTELGEAIKGISDFTNGMINTIKGLKDMQGGGMSALTGGIQAATGIMAMTATVGKAFQQIGKDDNKIEKAIKQSNRYLKQQLEELRYQSGQTKTESMQKYMESLRIQTEDSYNKMISMAKDSPLSAEGLEALKAAMAEGDRKEVSGIMAPSGVGKKFMKMYDQWEDLKTDIEEFQQQYQEYMTGATAGGIADGFTQALAEGKSFNEALGDNFEQVMQQAIIRSFKRKFLMEQLEPFMETLTDAAEGGFTEEEISNLKDSLGDATEDAKEQWEGIQEILEELGGGDTADPNDMTKAIKGVTEETAGLIEGRMHSMQMHVAQHVNIAQSSLNYLRKIEENTLYNKSIYKHLTKNDNITLNDDLRTMGN